MGLNVTMLKWQAQPKRSKRWGRIRRNAKCYSGRNERGSERGKFQSNRTKNCSGSVLIESGIALKEVPLISGSKACMNLDSILMLSKIQ